MYYLVEYRGLRAPVVKSVNTTSMAERLGERYGVPVYETPVGFKYVGPRMIETGAMMGGEESGGFGFGMHLPERDGIYTDLMLLDLFLRERAAGRWPVSKAIAHLHEIAGPSFYQRVDVHVDRDAYPALKDRLMVELQANAPTTLAGQPVTRTDALTTNDGFKFFIADGSWLLVRFSGTEPLVRVYTEATSQDADGRDHPRRRAAGPRRVTDADDRRRPARGGSRSPGATSSIWAETDRYAGKILVIETGRRLSLQYHDRKLESILVRVGPAPPRASRATTARSGPRSCGPARAG